MRTETKTFTYYQYDELSPAAKDRAYEAWRDQRLSDPDNYTLQEMMDSLKALAEAAGVTLVDWSIGPWSYSTLKVEFPDDSDYYTWEYGATGNLTGARAFAWLEHHVYGPQRIPWTTARYHKREVCTTAAGHTFAFSARIDKPGAVRSCPFTGVCYDDMLTDALRENITEGMTLRDAWQGLADVIQHANEGELDYLQSREWFEEGPAHDVEYDEDGDEA